MGNTYTHSVGEMRGTPSLWVTHTLHTHYTQCGGDERHPFTLGNTHIHTQCGGDERHPFTLGNTYTSHTHTQCGGDERHPFTLGNTYTHSVGEMRGTPSLWVTHTHTVWGR